LEADPQRWDGLVRTCRQHPLRQVIHTDPFTRRAYYKPRGYAGDAELLDFIYGREERWPPPEASPIGRRIFNYTTAAPAPEGVRARRGFVADLIDRLAEETRKPHILSIAAGHLREACLSAAVKRGRIGRFVALDADETSLQEAERCYSCFGVETVTARIRALLANRLDLGKFDLVYTTGLLDYLHQSAGRRLVSHMFGMLRPGGQLLVANFLPGIRDVGYIEAYMDWFLIYRTRRDMVDLTMEIPEQEIREVTLFTEENLNIIFLRVLKK
jgi:SAM-dependent methyltransferase